MEVCRGKWSDGRSHKIIEYRREEHTDSGTHRRGSEGVHNDKGIGSLLLEVHEQASQPLTLVIAEESFLLFIYHGPYMRGSAVLLITVRVSWSFVPLVCGESYISP